MCPMVHGSVTCGHRVGRRVIALVASSFVAANLAVVGAPPAGAVVPQAADPKLWQTDGRVRALARGNGLLYLGGDFSRVHKPNSTSGANRADLAALKEQYGGVQAAFRADTDGEVHTIALSADGAHLFVGGLFSTINGQPRANLARVDALTGAVDPWVADTSGEVDRLLVADDMVFVAGRFGQIQGVHRAGLARISSDSATLSTTFKPLPDAYLKALAISPDHRTLYVGGGFLRISGVPRPHVAALDADTAVASKWFARPHYPPTFFSLSSDGQMLYVAGAGGPTTGNKVSAFPTAGSAETPFLWDKQGKGNVQALALGASVVYAGGHFNTFEDQVRKKLVALNQSDGSLDPWAPAANSALGTWTLLATPYGLVAGGDFTTVDGLPQEHLVRFPGTP